MRRSGPAGHRKPQTRRGARAPERQEHHPTPRDPCSLLLTSGEILSLPEAVFFRKPLSGDCIPVQTVRRLRPLRRRAESTARPVLELMRERKPWVFLRRLLLGWKVLFMGSSYLSLQ